MDFNRYIDDLSLLNRDTLDELRQMVEDYPYFQLARLMYVANLYVLHDSAFGRELRKASVMLPSREALFHLFEAQNYEIEQEKTEKNVETTIETEEDRTISLIDNFLSTLPEQKDDDEKEVKPHDVPTVAEVTSDYAAFLEMQDEASMQEADTTDDRTISLIDNFIAETSGKQRYELSERPDEQLEKADESAVLDDAIYSTQIVNLLIKRGQYGQALEILRKICLNNPEKSATFAPQMRLLQILADSDTKN